MMIATHITFGMELSPIHVRLLKGTCAATNDAKAAVESIVESIMSPQMTSDD